MAETAPKTEVRVTRSEIPSPTLDDPKKITLVVQYQVGMLPPRFLYFNKATWTKEAEAAAIKADLKRVMAPMGETVTL